MIDRPDDWGCTGSKSDLRVIDKTPQVLFEENVSRTPFSRISKELTTKECLMPNMPKNLQTLIIGHVEPELDGGRYP
ncbi:MAG: hypothetical protein OEW33_13120, partial [Nitrospirota bacterium]|nr:hypothetical protein [Nitrospirota bacterium]